MHEERPLIHDMQFFARSSNAPIHRSNNVELSSSANTGKLFQLILSPRRETPPIHTAGYPLYGCPRPPAPYRGCIPPPSPSASLPLPKRTEHSCHSGLSLFPYPIHTNGNIACEVLLDHPHQSPVIFKSIRGIPVQHDRFRICIKMYAG